MKKNKTFNLVIVGYGGQGVITLAEIIANAAFAQGYEVKQTENHGLSQRGGLLECHLRFGQEVFSPLVKRGGADLIISLDLFDAFSSLNYVNKKKTIILTNSEIFSPYPFKEISPKKIIPFLKKISKKLILVPTLKLIGNISKETSMINTLILGYALGKKLLPIKKKFILKAMTEKIRPQFLEKNKKIFDLGIQVAKKH